MTGSASSPTPGRQERRKAETRRRIVASAEQLFRAKPYADTSLEEIAAGADVAVRTLYLHFDSKAAIMLSYFDDWVTAFVEAVLARRVDEPVLETARAALAALTDAGWIDRVEGSDPHLHPLVDHLRSGSPDIAGHVLHRWLDAVSQLAEDARRRLPSDADPTLAHARAMAIFSFWFGAMSAAREGQRAALPADAGGLTILAALTGGTL